MVLRHLPNQEVTESRQTHCTTALHVETQGTLC